MTDLVTEQAEFTSILPILIIFVPLLGSFGVILISSVSEKLRDIYTVIISAVPLVLLAVMYPLVQQGIVQYNIEWFLEIGLIFRLDSLGFLFTALISLIWFLATLYATEYISHEHNRNRFYFFWLFTFGATLGVFVTGDLFGLFVFFEMMSLTSYVLVIHEEDKDAMRAGNLFLFLGIGGGLAILFGLFIMYFNLETLEIAPMLGDMVAAGVNIPVLLLLFIIGFGIKAGIVPLHIWLPKAHPVAPTPASAILSGLLIKTGVYGLWRVFLMVMGPASSQEVELYQQYITNWGMGLFWIGIITMVLGALMALLQTSAKKMLAYSSVSQVGFIIMGLGAAVYLGTDGPIGFAGGIMHVINHALFKACLFLIVGAIFIRTHLLDIDRVRGMFKQMPFMGIAFIIAALGIAGVPLFNGYASKTILHHALSEVSYLTPGTAMFIADKIFVFTSALTVSYFIKLFRGLFLGKLPQEWQNTNFSVAPIIKVVVSVFVVLIIAIGVFPNFVLEQFVMPTMAGFPYESEVVTSQLQGMDLFTSKDLSKVVVVFLIAGTITLADQKFHWSRITPPYWLSIEALVYRNAITKLMSGIEKLGTTFDVSVQDFYETTGRTSVKVCRKLSELDKTLTDAYDKSGEGAMKLSEKTGQLDRQLDRFYDSTGEKASSMTVLWPVSKDGDKTLAQKEFEAELEKASSKQGKVSKYVTRDRKARTGFLGKINFDPSKLTVKNLNFDSFVIAFMLGISLLILIFYHRIF
ncbi:complex I subunit 5 family protein [Natranaerobius thermophilus]|uniref:NADH dehydrogenase (Quinone) n=1 Tax=Natranaerobius thermophilus (strain ATCC BAA-1301 / DSM 18059 / JW/NM-WN-LF) TaxID=457570 RepID=B2A694_NATTJ|nr:proton-conducting transporter membrane subunit [Natranaerobius thermophilus]ACB84105.1 NADH dehydrogenase (quinone) [Natranaerobius thermophilus JW/NM-WN-LF]